MRTRLAITFVLVVLAAVVHDRTGAGADRGAWPPFERVAREAVVSLRAAGPTRILIRGTTFVMGSTTDEIDRAVELCKKALRGAEGCEKAFANELEAHEVTLSPYYIDRTEVTVAAYLRCVELGRCGPPPFASGGQRFDRSDYPVTLVTWNDAEAFCRFDGGRLPTEAEWERAARGPLGRQFPWGNAFNQGLCNHGGAMLEATDDSDGFPELAPVGSFPAGRTADGIDDLAGNVEEWVADAIDDLFGAHYPPASEVNPKGASVGAFRVTRGGSYRTDERTGIGGSGAWLRGAARIFRPASARDTFRGFRCVHPLTEGL